MQAIYLKDNISDEQYQMAVRVLEAMNIAVIKSQSDTKMSEDAFYAKIDRALSQEPIEMSFSELKALHKV